MELKKIGVVSGRFRLLHKAHKEVITRATLEDIDELCIIVIDSPGTKRYSTITELRIALGNMLQGIDLDYQVLVISKEIATTEELEDFVIAHYQHHNIVMYDSRVRYQNVKLMNQFIYCPLSEKITTASIEDNPYEIENYENIAAEFMPYINRKIVISGTESSGKTQFSKKLANIYNTVYSPEVGRFYGSKYLGGDDEAFSPKDFVFIAMEQMQQDRMINNEAKRCLFVDTDPFVTLRFLNSYYQEYASRGVLTEEFEKEYLDAKEMLESVCKTYRCDLIILLAPTVDYIDDNLRWTQTQAERNQRFEELKQIYDNYKMPYIVIDSSDYKERFTQVETYLKKLF